MFKRDYNTGRPGTTFTFSIPTPPPAPTLRFSAAAPAAPHHAPAVNQCRLNTDHIIMGGVAGGIAMAPSGVGILPGIVGGTLAGAAIASHEQRKCLHEAAAAKAKAYNL